METLQRHFFRMEKVAVMKELTSDEALLMYPQLCALERLCFGDSEVPLEVGELNLVLVQEEEKQIVAMLNAKRTLFIKDPVLEITNLCTHPDYQKQGFASLLLQRALDLASEAHLKFAVLQVSKTAFAAQRLYAKFQFEQFFDRKDWKSLKRALSSHPSGEFAGSHKLLSPFEQ